MEPMNDETSKKEDPAVGVEAVPSFEDKLRAVILTRLEMLSPEGLEKVLDYINAQIDHEEKQLEFQRRKGRLYRLCEEEGQGQQL